MDELNEVKIWFLQEVIPSLEKSGKLKLSHHTNSKQLSETAKEKTYNVSVSQIGSSEAFMLTKCYRVKMTYAVENEEQTYLFIAKKTPNIPAENYDAVDFDTLYSNEIAAYTEIFPALFKFSNTNETDRNYPKYFYSSIKPYEATIVLGDFYIDGWKMSKDRVNLSLEHILLGAQHLGAFHGVCYALKTVDKNKFDGLISSVKDTRYNRPPPAHWAMMSSVSVDRLSKAVEKFCPDISKNFLKKLQQLLMDNFAYSRKRVEPIEPFATLCHGDYLRNNIAFAYDNKNPDLPINAMMFDFQTLRYSSPMIDLCVFLSLSAGKDVRLSHFDKIFDAYHGKLTEKYTMNVKGDVPEFLTKPKLLEEYVKYLPYGLGVASYFLATLHVPDGMSPEEMLGNDFDVDFLINDALTRGGDVVDGELASLVKELYELSVETNVDIFEGFCVIDNKKTE